VTSTILMRCDGTQEHILHFIFAKGLERYELKRSPTPFFIARSVARPSLTSWVILCGSATLRATFCRANLEWFLMFHLWVAH
jgi:hypothetical protein